MMTEDKAVVLVTLDIGDTYSGFAYTYRADFDKDGWKVQVTFVLTSCITMPMHILL